MDITNRKFIVFKIICYFDILFSDQDLILYVFYQIHKNFDAY